MRFADVLASSIHDIKNALGLVINTLEEISSDPGSGLADNPKAVAVQLEARRANNDLIQLLTLYKLDTERITPQIAEHNLEDFLEDIAVDHRRLARASGAGIDCRCDPYLSAYFDADLVRGVINNAIGNAARYTRDRLLLAADERDGYLVLRVEDNGPGFPPAMLEQRALPDADAGFARGRTRLGLYFSRKVAELHQNQGRVGRVELHNGCSLGGGCFSLWLP
jgi:signal transduction histidine kinase